MKKILTLLLISLFVAGMRVSVAMESGEECFIKTNSMPEPINSKC